MIVLAGTLSIVLGYRTFLATPRRAEKGEAKLVLPGDISIHVTRVGPGERTAGGPVDGHARAVRDG